MKYNPIVKNGTYQCSGFERKAADEAEARWKFAKLAGIQYGTPAYFALKIVELVPVTRKFKTC
jgi:hypothetical protein